MTGIILSAIAFHFSVVSLGKDYKVIGMSFIERDKEEY
jgi:hypothetical protein